VGVQDLLWQEPHLPPRHLTNLVSEDDPPPSLQKAVVRVANSFNVFINTGYVR